MSFDLSIEHKGKLYLPSILGGAQLEFHRRGTPAQLTFTMLADDAFELVDAANIKLQISGKRMFNGFLVSKSVSKDGFVDVVAKDQTHYFKAQAIKNFRNAAAGDIVREIAQDLQNVLVGDVSGPKFRVKNHAEDKTTYFDMIHNALAREWMNTGQLYTFFDDFGELTLRSLEEMQTDMLVDNTTAQDFRFSSTIGDRTFNKIVLVRKNEKKGTRDYYVEQDTDSINRLGTLVYFEMLTGKEDGKEKAQTLLKLFNHVTKTAEVDNNFGRLDIRGGSTVWVDLKSGLEKINNRMIVDRCVHKWDKDEHFMDLSLMGGSYVE